MAQKEQPKTNRPDPNLTMQVTKQGGFGNTTIVGSITIRTAATLVLAVAVGWTLWQSPVFAKNWPAIIAYIAFANIVLGHTPTGRNILTNLYGIVFKKPANMLVTEEMTTTTFGHGVSEVDVNNPNVDAIPFRMQGTKNYALVYNITSGIGYWSTDEEKVQQARTVKSLYNILEGGESLLIVEKQDNDTGMLKLKDYLERREHYEGEDLAAMSRKRSRLLYNAGTTEAGRSIQQYAILMVKPRNVNRTVSALKKTSRITRPATNPGDVLLSAMGFEGGVEWMRSAGITPPVEPAKPEERGED